MIDVVKIAGVVTSAVLLLVVLELVRRRRLNEEYSFFWILAVIALLGLSLRREILHVTFGSVLKETGPDGRPRFKDTFFGLLRGHPEAYAANLERHFVKHLKPFVGGR